MTDLAPTTATFMTAAATQSARSVALPRAIVMLGVVVALAGLAAQFATYLNHDVAWVLYSSKRLLGGGTFGQDIIAANPPLIWWISTIPSFLAQTFAISPVTAFRLCTFSVAAVSLIATERLMRDSMPVLPRAAFVLFCAFMFTAGAGRDFGQREMFAVMLTLPYLAAAASRMRHQAPDLLSALMIGAAAGIGIALKPYFIAVPLLVELVLIWKLRTWRTTIRPEAVGAVAVAIVYGVAIFMFARPWLSEVIFDVSKVYWAFSAPLSTSLPAYGSAAGLAALLALTLAITSRRTETIILAAAALGFLAAAMMQAKAYSYHIYPITTCLLLALATAIPGSGVQWRKHIAAIAIVALAATATGNIRALLHRSPTGDYGTATAGLIKLVRENVPAEGAFLAISTHPYPSFPVANYAQRELASARNSRLFMPAVIRLRASVAPADAALLSFAETKAHEAMRHDMALKPDLVLIDERPVRHAIGALPFDFIAFYKEDPAFARAWKAYEKIALPLEGFAAYRRRDGGNP